MGSTASLSIGLSIGGLRNLRYKCSRLTDGVGMSEAITTSIEAQNIHLRHQLPVAYQDTAGAMMRLEQAHNLEAQARSKVHRIQRVGRPAFATEPFADLLPMALVKTDCFEEFKDAALGVALAEGELNEICLRWGKEFDRALDGRRISARVPEGSPHTFGLGERPGGPIVYNRPPIFGAVGEYAGMEFDYTMMLYVSVYGSARGSCLVEVPLFSPQTGTNLLADIFILPRGPAYD